MLNGNLDVAAFPVVLTKGEKYTGEISADDGQSVKSILIGDAARTTHFFSGSSIENAMGHLDPLANLFNTLSESGSENTALKQFNKSMMFKTMRYHMKVMKLLNIEPKSI